MTIAVIGGGIQGIATAIALARRGAEVELFEANAELMQGASRRNEGKIHLGFVYANDPSLATARLMAQAATCFAPLITQWLERDRGHLEVSRPFTYAVHRGSLLDPEELSARYAAIGRLVNQAAAATLSDYFGMSKPGRVDRLSDDKWTRQYDPRDVIAAFETAEVAVDPNAIADQLIARVTDDPRIKVRLGTSVVAAWNQDSKVDLQYERGQDSQRQSYEHVVNCAWCGRLAIDATVGIKPIRPWSFRRKYYLRIPAGATSITVPNTTFVLGPYGDVVRYPNDETWLSWYPVGCQGIEQTIQPRDHDLNQSQQETIRRVTVEQLSRLIPSLGQLPARAVADASLHSGIIFANGTTDVDDPASQYHRRCEVGPRSVGRYHTVDTGKYVSGPLFADRLAERLMRGRVALTRRVA